MQWNCVLLLLTFCFAAGPAYGRAPASPIHAVQSDLLGQAPATANRIRLGRSLFFDKILSGNGNVSCATCHHPLTDTGDGLSLPSGEGARGLGAARDTGGGADAIHERVPRNSPPLFNLGAGQFTTLFHDGRLTADATQPSGFQSPAGDQLPPGLNNVLAAQAMFPVTSATEMAGQPGENSIADAAAADDLAGPFGVWAQLADRLREVPGYVSAFRQAFADIDEADDIRFVHAANAISAFESAAFRADDSPFDRFLRGDADALNDRAARGMALFYGRANCGSCHSGKFQTDHGFYAIAVPQIGPGKGDGFRTHEDFGRERVTGNIRDRYRFRVPSLRNVALTGPWGHDGAFATLEAAVRHHLDPIGSLYGYRRGDARLPSRADLDQIDFIVHDDPLSRAAIERACELEPVSLADEEVAELLEFLHALTDRASLDLRAIIPDRVPSGLPVFD